MDGIHEHLKRRSPIASSPTSARLSARWLRCTGKQGATRRSSHTRRSSRRSRRRGAARGAARDPPPPRPSRSMMTDLFEGELLSAVTCCGCGGSPTRPTLLLALGTHPRAASARRRRRRRRPAAGVAAVVGAGRGRCADGHRRRLQGGRGGGAAGAAAASASSAASAKPRKAARQSSSFGSSFSRLFSRLGAARRRAAQSPPATAAAARAAGGTAARAGSRSPCTTGRVFRGGGPGRRQLLPVRALQDAAARAKLQAAPCRPPAPPRQALPLRRRRPQGQR